MPIAGSRVLTWISCCAQHEIQVSTLDPAIGIAIWDIPRHEFVPENLSPFAYFDILLPVGYAQNTSQPFLNALITQLAVSIRTIGSSRPRAVRAITQPFSCAQPRRSWMKWDAPISRYGMRTGFTAGNNVARRTPDRSGWLL